MSEAPRPATVQVPLGVVVAAAAVLVAAGAAVAFLLGRASGRATPAVPPSSLSSPPSTSAPPPSGAPDGATPTEPTALSPPTEAAPAGSPPPTLDPDKEEIARYFRQLDAAEGRAKYWDDPEALAKALLDQTSRGDAGGFDKLISANQRAREELQALAVPAPCAEHHRLTLGLMDDAIALLKEVRDKAVAQDTGGLLAVPTAARELETKAREADRLAGDLKRAHGLAP